MGTFNYTTSRYGSGKTTLQTGDSESGSFSTSTSATDVSGLSLQSGQVIQAHADVAMWVRFGGATAAVGTGFFIPAGAQREWEVDEAGAVSVIDVA